jgi:formate/nitrite transporter
MHGGIDQNPSMERLASFVETAESAGLEYDVEIYSGADHAFTVFGGSRYQERADTRSWETFGRFLEETLRRRRDLRRRPLRETSAGTEHAAPPLGRHDQPAAAPGLPAMSGDTPEIVDPTDLDPQAIPEKAEGTYGDKVALPAAQAPRARLPRRHLHRLRLGLLPRGAGRPGRRVPFGVLQLLAGLAFSLGLILVMIAGAELFTGNTLMVTLWLQDENGWGDILRAWGLAYVGNLAGSLFVVVLFTAAGGQAAGDGLLADAAADLAGDKTGMGPVAILASGVLANMLVCLAVWMTFAAKSVQGKIIAMVPPIAAFVAAGLEHSVANMSLIPMGLAAQWTLGAAADATLGLAGFAWNLLWSTIGNVIGGAIIATAYWQAYGK